MPDITQNTRLREHPLICELLAIVDKFDLNLTDMVIFGSGPLLAKGLRANIHDLDIVARSKTWRLVKRHGERSFGKVNGARIAQFSDGLIQFSAGWVSEEWEAAALIDRAEIIQGLPFALLEDVLVYKQYLNRPKDRQDIDRLREFGVVPTLAAAQGRRARRGGLGVDREPLATATGTRSDPVSSCSTHVACAVDPGAGRSRLPIGRCPATLLSRNSLMACSLMKM